VAAGVSTQVAPQTEADDAEPHYTTVRVTSTLPRVALE
jgi:hypothetical protein